MKTESIRIIRVAMPLVYPFRTAFGNDEVIESILVQLCSGEHVGWGESACWKAPAYSPECSATQFVISRDFISPRLLHQEIGSGQELQDRSTPKRPTPGEAGNRTGRALVGALNLLRSAGNRINGQFQSNMGPCSTV